MWATPSAIAFSRQALIFLIPIIIKIVKEKVVQDLVINMAIATLFTTIKSNERKDQLKRAFLKLRNAINAAYMGDPDFE